MTGFNYQFIGRMSCVAGIMDRGGGIRVVITYPELLHHHIGIGERSFKVPDLWVQEPTAWGKIPNLVETVTNYIFDQLASEK